ncbi:MAG: Vitamin K epoxide reductase, partial [Parcubacteria group bacterium GW2011_GWF1_52_5]
MTYKTVAGFWIALAFLGLIDAGYITVKYYSGGEVACPITGGCSDVLTSAYSQIMGFPVSAYGLIF